jgi:hypothetical protein
MVDEMDPGQPFLWVNILRWREIFRDCQESRHPSLLQKTRPTASLLKNRAPASFKAMRGHIALQKRFARTLNQVLF